jgi:hypothetical protein
MLDKLLCNHPQMSVLSQALPSLLIALKQKFLRERGIDSYYPLSHYNNENRYLPTDFITFLNNEVISPEFTAAFLNQGYSGQYSPVELSGYLKKMSLADCFSTLLRQNSHNISAVTFGDKEVLCEEYVPYFINHNIKVVHVIRDPRDVVSSIYCGQGNKYVGSVKPMLFTLHNWRKSAQLALQFARNDNFLLVSYENLVAHPNTILSEIFAFLGVDDCAKHILSQDINDQNGDTWESNSSFGSYNGINTHSIGKYKKHLPISLIQYINCICLPELEQLSYQISEGAPIEAINTYREAFKVDDINISLDYSTSVLTRQNETSRLNRYINGIYEMEFNCQKVCAS